MKKTVYALLMAVLCCGVFSCTEKTKSTESEENVKKSYRFVKVGNDDKESVEEIVAKNDTDALNQYFALMEKIIIDNIGKEEEPYKVMYVISPEGDTLNTNEELLQAVTKDVPRVKAIPLGKAPIPSPAPTSEK
jgi:hypothetical protein